MEVYRCEMGVSSCCPETLTSTVSQSLNLFLMMADVSWSATTPSRFSQIHSLRQLDYALRSNDGVSNLAMAGINDDQPDGAGEVVRDRFEKWMKGRWGGTGLVERMGEGQADVRTKDYTQHWRTIHVVTYSIACISEILNFQSGTGTLPNVRFRSRTRGISGTLTNVLFFPALLFCPPSPIRTGPFLDPDKKTGFWRRRECAICRDDIIVQRKFIMQADT